MKMHRNWNNSVNIRCMAGIRIPTRVDIFLASLFGQLLEITSLPNRNIKEALSTRIKHPRRESVHPS